jgi:hypothetical protein
MNPFSCDDAAARGGTTASHADRECAPDASRTVPPPSSMRVRHRTLMVLIDGVGDVSLPTPRSSGRVDALPSQSPTAHRDGTVHSHADPALDSAAASHPRCALLSEFAGQTPLQMAHLPTLDALARKTREETIKGRELACAMCMHASKHGARSHHSSALCG